VVEPVGAAGVPVEPELVEPELVELAACGEKGERDSEQPQYPDPGRPDGRRVEHSSAPPSL
jgi:hypothetical protein